MSDRDCEKCKHHTEKGCDSWDCEFEKRMTREEAIEFIGQSVKNDVDMAKVADAIIAIEQKPCEDAVNRKAINNLRKYNLVGGIVTVSLKDINKLPPANPQYEQIEPCEDVAKECYEDLCEYFGGAKNILKNREDFKAWLGRVRWHIHKVDELSAENDDLRDQLAMRDRFQKQELCEDAISREELLKAIDTWDKFGYTETGCFVREPKGDYVPYIHYDDVIRCIKGMPSVKPQEPKTGHWREDIDNNRKWDRVRFYCSECGGWQTYGRTHYCPNCGAKMQEEEE